METRHGRDGDGDGEVETDGVRYRWTQSDVDAAKATLRARLGGLASFFAIASSIVDDLDPSQIIYSVEVGHAAVLAGIVATVIKVTNGAGNAYGPRLAEAADELDELWNDPI